MSNSNLTTIRDYLVSATVPQLANNLISQNPWLFQAEDILFDDWASDLLKIAGYDETSSLHLVGSASVGFSLAPEKAGRPFRNKVTPSSRKLSDLDFALVDERLFVECWNRMTKNSYTTGLRGPGDHDQYKVYWGRIDKNVLEGKQLQQMLKLAAMVQKKDICKRYSASVRLYRRREDLLAYSAWCIRTLKKEFIK